MHQVLIARPQSLDQHEFLGELGGQFELFKAGQIALEFLLLLVELDQCLVWGNR